MKFLHNKSDNATGNSINIFKSYWNRQISTTKKEGRKRVKSLIYYKDFIQNSTV